MSQIERTLFTAESPMEPIFMETFRSARVRIFGKPDSWRTTSREAQRRIGHIASHAGIQRVFAPLPSEMNGRIANRRVLETEGFHYIGTDGSVMFFNGQSADGIDHVGPSDAYWLASADCLAVVLIGDSRIVPCHAGLRSLVRWRDGDDVRGHRSVLRNALDLFPDKKVVRAKIFCGIRRLKYSPSHPEYGEDNLKLITRLLDLWGEEAFIGGPEEGNISLEGLAMRQLLHYGVRKGNIESDGIDTASEPNLHSNSQGDQGCNGILVTQLGH